MQFDLRADQGTPKLNEGVGENETNQIPLYYLRPDRAFSLHIKDGEIDLKLRKIDPHFYWSVPKITTLEFFLT